MSEGILVCRLCLSQDNLTPIFGITEQIDGYSHTLYLTTGLQIEPTDGFPQSICGQCRDEVNSALKLRNRSQQSEIKIIELGYQRIIEVKNILDEADAENILQIDEINTEINKKHDTSNENEADYENNDELPEIKVEIQCDRLEQDGGGTKCPPDVNVRKLTRKEKRQQYLDLVDGKFDPKGPVKCKICKKSVSKWTCFISHARLHLGFNFVCEFCGKSFLSTTQLKRHCRSYHGMRRELPCKHCSYLALDNAQLKLHERRMHTFERPYICDACGASYHSRRCLVQHIESHRTVAAVQCDQCPQAFKSARQLSRHRYRTHKHPTPHTSTRTTSEDVNL